ncbi:MAG: amidohydrolase family protein [Thermaerobacter sp.]|nr:amidohydrolase family protein [Thermaerobacter sp.]
MIVDARVRVTLPDRNSDLRPLELPSYMEQYNQVIQYGDHYRATDENLMDEMRNNDVARAFLHAEREFPEEDAHRLNEHVLELQMRHPDTFIGFATVNTSRIRSAVAELRRTYELGLRGLNLQPCFLEMEPVDRHLYPLYAEAEALGIPVALHTGINYSRRHSLNYDHPLYLDTIACDFPDLTIIACHGAWPWVADMVAIARKHPTVYIELGGLAPKYLAVPGSGWEMLLHFGQNVLREQVLFATDWPIMSFGRAIAEMQNLPITAATKEAWMQLNGARLWDRLQAR